MKESVLSLREKNKHHWFSYFQIGRNYFKSFMTDTFNIIFDYFAI